MNNRFALLLLGIVLLSGLFSCGKTVLTATGKQYIMDATEAPLTDSIIYYATEPFRSNLQATMSEVLCTSSKPMEKGNPEGRLGDFVSEICLVEGNATMRELGADSLVADFVVLNNGGLRKPLPKGDITLGDLYEVMPFENRLVLIEMDGTSVQALCDFIAAINGTPVSGIRFFIDKKDSSATGISIGDNTLQIDKDYLVLTADYLANSGDKFPFTKLGKVKLDTGLKIRDALISHCRKQGELKKEISYEPDGRISYANQ
ncbi:MAG: 5'-nucleotidase C-terminal domain-containing protein [Bacteroidota bacterium]